ncbi:transcription antitermination factor NusB [Pyruvatibacter mobilis]|uniref:transcription antitermination factor NusB n=1 Tax=Pyruvatibacter mobilis TaxID=1712261 RepID=UPI003BAD64B4
MSEASNTSDEKAGKVSERHQARSNARLAAVQALYQMDVGGADIGDVIAEFRAARLGRAYDGDTAEELAEDLPADADFFESIVRGVVERQGDIDPSIDGALAKGWRLPRLDATLRAILRAGTFEIYGRSDVPPKTVINEYVTVAKAFFEKDEPRVVNAVLDRLARELLGDV